MVQKYLFLIFGKILKKCILYKNVKKCLFGYIKSPIDNRNIDDKYGVPITFGCEHTIGEIKECLKQIAREFKLKEAFVGTDFTMFSQNSQGEYKLPSNGLFKTYNADSDGKTFWEVFDPSIRESSYYARLKELYERLETEVGTSTGILTKQQTSNATATEIKQAMYDTFTLIDDMRSNIEEGVNDYLEACNILINAFISNASSEYKVLYDWDYSLVEDAQEGLNNLSMGVDKGVVSKAELRNYIKSSETLEESQKAVDEITKTNPSVKDLLGTE